MKKEIEKISLWVLNTDIIALFIDREKPNGHGFAYFCKHSEAHVNANHKYIKEHGRQATAEEYEDFKKELQNIFDDRILIVENYYQKELNRLNSEFIKFQFTSEGDKTRWMDFNKESAGALIDFIKIKYPDLF